MQVPIQGYHLCMSFSTDDRGGPGYVGQNNSPETISLTAMVFCALRRRVQINNGDDSGHLLKNKQ